MKVESLMQFSMVVNGLPLFKKKGDVFDLDNGVALQLIKAGALKEVKEEVVAPKKKKTIEPKVIEEPVEEVIKEVVEQDAVPTID